MTPTHFLIAVDSAPEYRDFISAGTYILGTLITILGAVMVAMINRTNNNAKKAAAHSEPTGNGFVQEVTEALERIENTQTEQGKDIGGIRGDMRAERTERMALARVVDRLIEKEG